MARLADLSHRQGSLLLRFDSRVHFRQKKGWGRRAVRFGGYRGSPELIYFATARRLFDLGLCAVGRVEGRDAVVLTAAGRAMAETIRSVRARQAAPAATPAAEPHYWWQDR